MPFHLQSVWGMTLMPLMVCDRLGWNKIVRVGNSGPVLRRLWTKVHEILGQGRRPFVLPNSLAQVSISRFVQNKFAIKYRTRRKTEQMQKFLAPNFSDRHNHDQLLYGRLLARFTVHRLAQFRWVPFADLGLRSLAMK